MKRFNTATLFSGLVMAAACTTVAVASAGYRYSGANVSVTTTWGTGAAGAARNSNLANEEFHPLMLQLSAIDRDTVMRRLFVAVNAGRVAMRATGLPF